MNDDNFGTEIDNDFDEFDTEFDVYSNEVDNKVWINELLEGIELD